MFGRPSLTKICTIAALAHFLQLPDAQAESKRVTIGSIEVSGPRVKHHAELLQDALAYELSRQDAWTVVANAERQRIVDQHIRDTHKHRIPEGQWIPLGRSMGATHVILGRLRGHRDTCSGVIELIDLTTQQVQPSPRLFYDCRPQEVPDLARHLGASLGAWSLAGQTQDRRKPVPRPRSFVMHGDEPAREQNQLPPAVAHPTKAPAARPTPPIAPPPPAEEAEAPPPLAEAKQVNFWYRESAPTAYRVDNGADQGAWYRDSVSGRYRTRRARGELAGRLKGLGQHWKLMSVSAVALLALFLLWRRRRA